MFETVTAKNGVVYLRSDILKARHGFSTRIGGVSAEAYTASLNLAFGRGDCKNTVLKNLELFSEAVGIDAGGVISLPQVHSATVLEVDGSDRGRGYFNPAFGEGDGYITDKAGVALGVKSADCVPILLEGESEKGEIAVVCALHAGWRGTVGGIARVGVESILKKGVPLSKIRAAIGPAIGKCCFEVGEEFPDAVACGLGKYYAEKFVEHRGNKLYADIKGMNAELLASCGVSFENIDICSDCTFCLEEKYYSHRRMNGIRGTMLSVIALDIQ